MGGGRGGTVCGEDGVCELKEGVCPAVEAFVERAAEGANSTWGGSMMRPSCTHREPSASFAASAVKTQQAVEKAFRIGMCVKLETRASR